MGARLPFFAGKNKMIGAMECGGGADLCHNGNAALLSPSIVVLEIMYIQSA